MLCLVALGRNADADRAIEAMIVRDPLYRASDDDLSPRLRSAFGDMRRRLLPAIIQKEYADSKAAFDKKDFGTAAAGFEAVLKGIADPDMSAFAAVPPLSDLRTLAMGFRDLSAKSTPPVLPPVAVAPARAVRTTYSADDAGVVPVRVSGEPVAVPLSGQIPFRLQAQLAMRIDHLEFAVTHGLARINGLVLFERDRRAGAA